MLGLEPKTTLKFSAQLWFLTATLGMWAFVYYLLAYYIGPVLNGGLEVLAQTRLPNGFIEGDMVGNIAVATHLFVSVIIIGGGPLQFIPAVRRYFPQFHRWNGRIYVATAILTSFAGLYMTWIRGDETGRFIQQVAVSISAILIIIFAVQAWRTARVRKFSAHREWALRLFLVANAAWFLRIGYQLWNFIRNGSIAYDPSIFQGTFIVVWNFGQFLVPLVVLELYLYAEKAGSSSKLAATFCVGAATLLMGIGIYAATFGMWLPRVH